MIIYFDIDFTDPPIFYIRDSPCFTVLTKVLQFYEIRFEIIGTDMFVLMDKDRWMEYIQPYVKEGSLEVVSGELKKEENIPKLKQRIIRSNEIKWME